MSDKTILEQIEALSKKTDFDWYYELAKSDKYGKTLNEEELTQLINNSMQSAEDVYKHLLTKHDIIEAIDYIKEYNLNLVFSDVDGFRLYIAMYDDGTKEIDVNMRAIERIKEAIVSEKVEHILDQDKVLEVALMHELYHHLEMNLPDIYTNRKIIKKKFLWFNLDTIAEISSEIAATHFSRISNNLAHNAKLYEKVLTLKGR